MIQTKTATGFKRGVQRVVFDNAPLSQSNLTTNGNGTDYVVGDQIPDDLRDEPQVVLVKGDVIQISSQRQDMWAFGTKLKRDNLS